ncbi:hypothetical protein QTP88_009077 [Uroleucon formosanum]
MDWVDIKKKKITKILFDQNTILKYFSKVLLKINALLSTSNFDANPPPILIDNGMAVLENEKIERHIMKNVPGGYNLFVQDKEVATLIENLYSFLNINQLIFHLCHLLFTGSLEMTRVIKKSSLSGFCFFFSYFMIPWMMNNACSYNNVYYHLTTRYDKIYKFLLQTTSCEFFVSICEGYNICKISHVAI